MPAGAHPVVLSPHLDDAVFSAFHVLAGGAAATVVTVFAGVPGPGVATTLDRARGGPDSASIMRRRRAEDAEAIGMTGAASVQLDLLDIDYRADAIPALRDAIAEEPHRFIPLVAAHPELELPTPVLADAIERALGDEGPFRLYAPLSVGEHPDHRAVARAGLFLRDRGHSLCLYADLPYLFRHGLPSWLGDAPEAVADAAVERAFAALGLTPSAFARRVEALEPAQLARKRAAMGCYRTEYALVDRDFGGVLDEPVMRFEVRWCRTGDR